MNNALTLKLSSIVVVCCAEWAGEKCGRGEIFYLHDAPNCWDGIALMVVVWNVMWSTGGMILAGNYGSSGRKHTSTTSFTVNLTYTGLESSPFLTVKDRRLTAW